MFNRKYVFNLGPFSIAMLKLVYRSVRGGNLVVNDVYARDVLLVLL